MGSGSFLEQSHAQKSHIKGAACENANARPFKLAPPNQSINHPTVCIKHRDSLTLGLAQMSDWGRSSDGWLFPEVQEEQPKLKCTAGRLRVTVYGSGHKGKCLPHALSLVPPRSGASRAELSDLCNQSLPEKYPLTGEGVFSVTQASLRGSGILNLGISVLRCGYGNSV